MESYSGRVSKVAFKSIVGTAFLFSIIASVIRIGVRLWRERRLQLDDYFLLISCACLTTATVLFYHEISTIFFLTELIIEPARIAESGLSEKDIQREFFIFQTTHRAFVSINWTSIFAVKFGFLSFFRHLVDRIPTMHAFWRGTVVATAFVAIFCVFHSFFYCPRTGLDSVQCFFGPGAIKNGLALGISTAILDIVTDLLIITIPVSLIWKVQIKARQKLGLAAFLCLSIAMIIIAIIRISGWRYKGAYDTAWIFLWQQVESCVAVTMLSLTAFRSIFVPQPSSNGARQWISSPRIFLYKRKRPTSSSSQCLNDVIIPSATMTGLDGFLHRSEVTHSLVEDSDLATRWSTGSMERLANV